MRTSQAIEALDRRVQQLGVGREGDVLGLHRGVDRDPRQVLGPQRATLMGHPQALSQQQVQGIITCASLMPAEGRQRNSCPVALRLLEENSRKSLPSTRVNISFQSQVLSFAAYIARQ
jgi:hypothetical protein